MENVSKQALKSAKVKDKKDESSSSDSELEASQKHSKLEKVTMKKNFPKPAMPKSTLNTSEENTRVNPTTTEKSFTVMSGMDRMVPDGISPILKTPSKAKLGGVAKPTGADSGKREKNSKKRK